MPYPSLFKHSHFKDFKGFGLPSISSSGSLPGIVQPTVQNHRNVFQLPGPVLNGGVIGIRLRNASKTRSSKSFSLFNAAFADEDSEENQDVELESSFWFAPLGEELGIEVKVLNLDSKAVLDFELFSAKVDGRGRLKLKPPTPTKAGWQEVGTWDGAIVNSIFPGGCLTAARSPYKLKVTASKPGSQVKYPIAWTYFEVVASRIELYLGALGRLADFEESRSFEEQCRILREVRQDEKEVPDIRIRSDFYSRTVAEMEPASSSEDPCFRCQEERWAEGPNIPLLAKVFLRTSDYDESNPSEEQEVFEPKALGSQMLAWVCKCSHETSIIADAGARSFVEEKVEEQEAFLPAFVEREPSDAFPFSAEPDFLNDSITVGPVCGTGKDAGFGGVFFRPPIVAGCVHEIRAALVLPESPTSPDWVIGDDPESLFEEAPHASLSFRVSRSLTVAGYFRKSAQVQAIDETELNRLFAPAGIRLEFQKKDLIRLDYGEIFQQVKEADGYDNDRPELEEPTKDFHFLDAAALPDDQGSFDGVLECVSFESFFKRVCTLVLGVKKLKKLQKDKLNILKETTLWSMERLSLKQKTQDPRDIEILRSLRERHGDEKLDRAVLVRIAATQKNVVETLGKLLSEERSPGNNSEKWLAGLEALYRKRCDQAARDVVRAMIKRYLEDFDDSGKPGLVILHFAGLLNLAGEARTVAGFHVDPADTEFEEIRLAPYELGAVCITVALRSLESTVAHEIGHARSLCHAPFHAEENPPCRDPEKVQTFALYHDLEDRKCLMGYLPDADHFCGLCVLRLRGWKLDPLLNPPNVLKGLSFVIEPPGEDAMGEGSIG